MIRFLNRYIFNDDGNEMRFILMSSAQARKLIIESTAYDNIKLGVKL